MSVICDDKVALHHYQLTNADNQRLENSHEEIAHTHGPGGHHH